MNSPEAPKRAGRGKALFLLGLLLVAGAFALRLLPFRHIVEDAYISFRYAENLAAGNGIVFNPGERVEGYSNFLWVMVLAGARSLGLPIPAVSQTLGLLFSLLTLGATFALVLRWTGDCGTRGPFFALAAPLLLGLWPPFAAWTLSGMETSMFAFWVTAAFACYGVRDGEPSPAVLARMTGPLALLMACLTRPEGLYFAGCILGWAMVRRIRSTRSFRHVLERGEVWLFLLPTAAYYDWKLWYYGYPLPNSFYAKYGLASEHLGRGMGELRLFLLGALGLLFLLAALSGLRFKPFRRLGWILAGVSGFIACIAYMGGDIYPFSRYFVPVMPALVALAAAALVRGWVHGRPHALRLTAAAAAVLIAWTAFPPGFRAEMRSYEFLKNNDEERTRFVKEAGYLFTRGDSIALQDAGIIPYHLEIPAVDMLGLNDAHIAHLRVPPEERGIFGHEKYDADYILRRRPSVVFFALHHWRTDQVALPSLSVPGPVPFARTFPLIKLRFRSLPAQTYLWEHPLFKLAYTPVLARYGDRMIILYRRDEAFAALEGRPRSTAAILPLLDRFIEKGCYREGERYLAGLVSRGEVSGAVLEEYRKRLERVPQAALQEYEAARGEALGMHKQIIDELLGKGEMETAWRALMLASRYYPDSEEAREWRRERYRGAGPWAGALSPPGPKGLSF